jgi:hypothetical protein
MEARIGVAAEVGPAVAGGEAIIPLKGLWGVGVVLAGLVVAIVGNWLWVLNFFHVAAGGLWTSIDLFMGFVVGPLLRRLDVPARLALTRRLMPQMLLIMPTLVLVTLTSGWQLARSLGYVTISYPQHWWLVASFLVVGVMAIIAYGVLEPANITVLLELHKPNPNGALIGRLMQRFIYTAGITGCMQVATLIIMSRIATW